MDPTILETSYRKSSSTAYIPRNHRVLSPVGVAVITYFFGCGGPIGSEPIISSAGPLIGLPCLIFYPLLVLVPYAYIVAELCSAFPEDGGFTVWVLNSFGPFWGFQVGYWSWTSGLFKMAVLPAFLLGLLEKYAGVHIASGVVLYLVKMLLAVLFTLPSLIGSKFVSRSLIGIFACVIIPVIVYTVWGYTEVRDPGDLFELRHTKNIAFTNGTNDEQVGPIDIQWSTLLNTLFWSYDGINMASVFGGEVQNPARAYPQAIKFTVIMTMLTYILPMPPTILMDNPNWTYFTSDSFPETAAAIGGSVLQKFILVSSCCGTAGLFISGLFCKSYQLSGMADNQMLPALVSSRNNRFETPHVSILITLLFTLPLLGLDIDDLVPLTNAFAGAVQILIIMTVIRLRKLLPYVPRPTKVPGGTNMLYAVAVIPTVMMVYITIAAFKSLVAAVIILGFVAAGIIMGLLQKYCVSSRASMMFA